MLVNRNIDNAKEKLELFERFVDENFINKSTVAVSELSQGLFKVEKYYLDFDCLCHILSISDKTLKCWVNNRYIRSYDAREKLYLNDYIYFLRNNISIKTTKWKRIVFDLYEIHKFLRHRSSPYYHKSRISKAKP